MGHSAFSHSHIPINLPHTHIAGRDVKNPSSDLLSLLQLALLNVLFLHLVSSGLVDHHAHISLGSCKRVHSRTDRSGQSTASFLQGPGENHNKQTSGPSNEPMQKPAAHTIAHKHTQPHKGNHSPECQS